MKDDHAATLERSEKEVADLKEKEVLVQKSAVEDYKALDDLQETMEQATSKYFGEDFDLCNKHIGRLHPDLDI